LTKKEQRRWVIAFAISIALNEIMIGLVRQDPPRHEDHVEPTIVTLVQHTPPPTPRPTPTPTPPPVVHVPPHATPAPHPQVAAPKSRAPKEATRGGSVSRKAKPVPSVVAELSHSDVGQKQGETGTGNGTGTGPGDGGGDNGNGTGNGAGGNGTGAVNANTPCGVVDFQPEGYGEVDGATIRERIVAIVHFPDGHIEQSAFPYKWTYPDGERTDPWSATNLRLHAHDVLAIPAQQPPPNLDVDSFPALIQYILQHTDARGHTNLAPCPKVK